MNLYLRSTKLLVGITNHTSLTTRKGEGRRAVELNDEDEVSLVGDSCFTNTISKMHLYAAAAMVTNHDE